jgi:hypothetical protein
MCTRQTGPRHHLGVDSQTGGAHPWGYCNCTPTNSKNFNCTLMAGLCHTNKGASKSALGWAGTCLRQTWWWCRSHNTSSWEWRAEAFKTRLVSLSDWVRDIGASCIKLQASKKSRVICGMHRERCLQASRYRLMSQRLHLKADYQKMRYNS